MAPTRGAGESGSACATLALAASSAYRREVELSAAPPDESSPLATLDIFFAG